MSTNDWKSRLGMVYSTNPDYEYKETTNSKQTLPAGGQDLRVWLDKKQRAGKKVTLVKGFVGSDDKLKEIAALLKSKCGVGGTAKDGEIIIQGDFRDRIVDILTAQGYKAKKQEGESRERSKKREFYYGSGVCGALSRAIFGRGAVLRLGTKSGNRKVDADKDRKWQVRLPEGV